MNSRVRYYMGLPPYNATKLKLPNWISRWFRNDDVDDAGVLKQSVDSSNLEAVAYHPELEILQIVFISGGIYRYYEVPITVYNNLIKAQSHGKYFHKAIKDKYRFEQIR